MEYRGGKCVNKNLLPLRQGIDFVDLGQLKQMFEEFFKVSFHFFLNIGERILL